MFQIRNDTHTDDHTSFKSDDKSKSMESPVQRYDEIVSKKIGNLDSSKVSTKDAYQPRDSHAYTSLDANELSLINQDNMDHSQTGSFPIGVHGRSPDARVTRPQSSTSSSVSDDNFSPSRTAEKDFVGSPSHRLALRHERKYRKSDGRKSSSSPQSLRHAETSGSFRNSPESNRKRRKSPPSSRPSSILKSSADTLVV